MSTRIGDAGLAHLTGLTDLEDLDLDATAITDAGLEHLKALGKLRRLQFAYTAVTDAGLKHLQTLSNLRGLNTATTKVTPQGWDKLKRHLPQLEGGRPQESTAAQGGRGDEKPSPKAKGIEKGRDDKHASIVGAWESLDIHLAMGTLYQPLHRTRQRESTVYFRQDGDRLTGHSVTPKGEGLSGDKEWPDGRTDFRTVTFADGRLVFEFDIREVSHGWGHSLRSKGTIRVEARLRGDRLVGKWGLFTKDGSEPFRGEWEAVRAADDKPWPKDDKPRPAGAKPQPVEVKPRLASGLVRSAEAVPTRGEWGGWLRYFRGGTRATDDLVVLAVTVKPGQAPHPPHRHVEEEFLILTEGRALGIWAARSSPLAQGT